MNQFDLENSFTISPYNLAVEENVAPAITTEEDLHTYLSDQPTIEGIAEFIATWSEEGKTCEQDIARSHTRLYELLARGPYQFYLRMKNDETPDAVRLQLREALDKCLADQGMKTQEKTNDMNRIVKAVFCGQDRRRVSAYAKALLAAAQENVTVEALPDWIATNGGIEKVRLGTKAPGPANLAAIAKEYLTENVLFTVGPDADAALFGVDDEDKSILLFATYRATGEIEINSVAKHDSPIATAAYAAYYSANKKALTAAKQTAALFN